MRDRERERERERKREREMVEVKLSEHLFRATHAKVLFAFLRNDSYNCSTPKNFLQVVI
jgi:hypothetical protein